MIPCTNFFDSLSSNGSFEMISFKSYSSFQPTNEKTEKNDNNLLFPNKEKIIKKFIGNKKGKNGNHNKFSTDNIRKKVIKIIINGILRDFLNTKINDGKNEIKKLKSKDFKKAAIIKQLLAKQIKDIFSLEINITYKNFEKDYNKKKIIELEEQNSEIKNILNCTLSECLNYLIKNEEVNNNSKLECLRGLEQYYDELLNLKEKENDDEEKKYLGEIVRFIENFETTLFNIKERKRKEKLLNTAYL